jgi:hypothetical protein
MQYIDERVIDPRHILRVYALLNIPYHFSDMSSLSDGGRSLRLARGRGSSRRVPALCVSYQRHLVNRTTTTSNVPAYPRH